MMRILPPSSGRVICSYPSKEHPERHGFGTISMRNIVENAGGHIEFEMEAGKFTVQIMLGDASPCS